MAKASESAAAGLGLGPTLNHHGRWRSATDGRCWYYTFGPFVSTPPAPDLIRGLCARLSDHEVPDQVRDGWARATDGAGDRAVGIGRSKVRRADEAVLNLCKTNWHERPFLDLRVQHSE